MPTYQYACTSCGDQLEVVQKFTDDPLTECPKCQGRLRKVFSAVGVVFKGSGFYKTDSRSKSSPSSSSTTKEPAKSASTSSSDNSSSGSTSAGSGTGSSGSSSSSSGTSSSSSSGSSTGEKVA